MEPRIAVIYYSATGTTYRLAKAIEEGAREAGAEVRLRKVQELAPEEAIRSNPKWVENAEATKDIPEAKLDDLEWAQGILFGTPTRYGLPTAQLKQFIDQTGSLWMEGKLADKIISSFTCAATPHGGQETTITALNNTFYHWGAIVTGLGYTEHKTLFTTGNPYGISFASNNAELRPDEPTLQVARLQGGRVTRIVKRFYANPS